MADIENENEAQQMVQASDGGGTDIHTDNEVTIEGDDDGGADSADESGESDEDDG